jgi:diguanylate cyclase (GGDEF)-like protein
MDITAQPIDLDGTLVSITISSGVANLSGAQETFDKLLSRADQALYRAKEAGRNKIVVDDEL